jgi:prenyltransferase beta subunit
MKPISTYLVISTLYMLLGLAMIAEAIVVSLTPIHSYLFVLLEISGSINDRCESPGDSHTLYICSSGASIVMIHQSEDITFASAVDLCDVRFLREITPH